MSFGFDLNVLQNSTPGTITLEHGCYKKLSIMMTSSNGNIFRVTGPF